MKWLDLLGNSLGFNPGPISDLASSSQLALVIPPNSPVDSAHEPSLVHSPPVQDLSEVLYTIHGHQQQKPHSCLDCASYTKIQEGLSILQFLVFELRKDLDELHFHLEVLEWKGIKFLKILLALHGTCNPSDVEPNAPRNKKPIQVLAMHRHPQEEATPLATHMHLEEEATSDMDPMLKDTS
jgi:hypothetical protein